MIAPHEGLGRSPSGPARRAERKSSKLPTRQLMRKYHPDVAGTDRERAAILHERAKEASIGRTRSCGDPKAALVSTIDSPPSPGGSAPPPWRPVAAAPSEASRRSASVSRARTTQLRPAKPGSGVPVRGWRQCRLVRCRGPCREERPWSQLARRNLDSLFPYPAPNGA